MDTFAALALATEAPHDELLLRKPYKKKEAIVTPIMWRNVLAQSIYQIIILMTLLFFGSQIFGIPNGRQNDVWTTANGVQYTIIFNTFVFMQCFNEINARKLKNEERNVFEGFFSNGLFIFVEVLTIVVQIIFVEIGGQALRLSPLTAPQHIVCIVIGAGSLIIGYWIKGWPDSWFANIHFLKGEQIKTEADLAFTKQASLRKSASMRSQNSLNRKKSK